MITLGAAFCWSIYTAYAGPYLRRISPLRATAWSTVAGTAVLAPVAVLQLGTIDLGQAGPEVAGAIVYSGLLSAGISNVVVLNGVKVVGPTRTAALQYLIPALAVVLAAIFMAEAIRPGQVLGGLVIVAGVVLTRSSSRRPQERLSPS